MNFDDIFERGLHKLTNDQLITLANSQQVLLNEATTRELVYLIQELVSRFEDLADHRASQMTQASEFNG